MNKYEKYKDSGFDWIGEIPEHWNVKKLKYLAFANPSNIDKKSKKEEKEVFLCNYVDVYKNDFIHKGIKFMRATASDSQIEKFKLGKGDVIATKDSETADDIGVPALVTESFDNVVCGYHLTHIKPAEIKGEFLYRFFQTQYLKSYFEVSANGVTRYGLGVDKINSAFIIEPSPNEQTVIANYLDRKTAEIDELISQKEQLLKLYEEEKTAIINQAVTKGINPDVKLKDSGIDWLGEIPEHWEVKKLKYVCKIQGRIGFKGYRSADLVINGEGAITLGASHISKKNKIDLSNPIYLNWEKYYESPEIMVKKNDIVFTQRGAYLGKVGFIDKNYGEVTINPSLILLKNIKVNSEFLSYFLTSNFIRENVSVISSDTAIPMISQHQTANFYCIFPKKEEQTDIVQYIKTEINRINTKAEKTKKLIDLLSEYKQSLISEVVTGKIKVI